MEAPDILDAARRQFQGDGYAVIPDIWTKAEVQQAIDALDALIDDIRTHPLRWQEHVVWQSDVPERQLTGIPQALRAAAATQPYIIGDLASHSAVLRRMILDARCRRIAEALLGTESICHFSNATIRAANGGCACNWHRDWPNSYCTTHIGRQLRILICLDGMQAEQGATRIIRGSQHWNDQQFNTWKQEEHPWDETGHAVTCSPGSVVVLGSRIVHGAGNNLSAVPRRNLIAQWGAREDLICAQVFESVLGLTA